jgi:hypothetical protein
VNEAVGADGLMGEVAAGIMAAAAGMTGGSMTSTSNTTRAMRGVTRVTVAAAVDGHAGVAGAVSIASVTGVAPHPDTMINAVVVAVGTIIDTIMTIQNGPVWRSARVISRVNVTITTTTMAAVATITIITIIIMIGIVMETMGIGIINPISQRQHSSCVTCPNPSPAT